MDSDITGELSPQDSDYDGAWKEALRLHLPDFLAKFFAAVHAAIDWHAPLEWRDKELSQILGQAGSRNQRVDLLAKVSLISGEPQWILLHLEIQSSSEPEFAQRIARPFQLVEGCRGAAISPVGLPAPHLAAGLSHALVGSIRVEQQIGQLSRS